MKIAEKYQDLALVMAWPEQTARGDERWMALFKKLGIVKNLNFKVGHAAILLIERMTGKVAYFDFGRYITPRGYGRARSATTDPRLRIRTRIAIDAQGEIRNLNELLEELNAIEHATHGGKGLYFSIAKQVSFTEGARYAQTIINQGPTLYGALARKNNSCSRYVAQILLAAYRPGHPARRGVYFPESLKASPMSNVVNANPSRTVYCFEKGKLRRFTMNRYASLAYQISLLSHNIIPKKAAFLPPDTHPGYMSEPTRPVHIPKHAQWLGGIGEGVWYVLKPDSLNTCRITRYNSLGEVDYEEYCTATEPLNLEKDYRFTYDCHHGSYLLRLEQKKIRLTAVAKNELVAFEKQNKYL